MENIHIKQRNIGVTFAIKKREAKDRSVDPQFRNALDELLGDTANFGVRKRDEETHAAVMKLVQSVVERCKHK